MTIKMRSAYGDELLHALRAGRVEVFSNEDESFTGYKEDPGALQVILKTLRDPRPDTRRLAVEMLARMGSMMAVPDLVERLSDDNASVRAASTKALADLNAKAVFPEIILGLDDPDDAVREEALAALPKLGIDTSPELVRTLEHMLKDKNAKISSHAAVALVYLGEIAAAKSFLLQLFKSEDVEKRLTALDAIGHIAGTMDGRFPIDPDFILSAVDDPSPMIRRDAIHVLSILNATSDLVPITNCLADEDVGVRKNASEFLYQAWPASKAGIAQILEEMHQKSLDAALDAIPPGNPEFLDDLRGYIQREVSNTWYLLTLANSFDADGQVVSLLVATLRHRESLSEERLI
jgi:HEAT repeat protein